MCVGGENLSPQLLEHLKPGNLIKASIETLTVGQQSTLFSPHYFPFTHLFLA